MTWSTCAALVVVAVLTGCDGHSGSDQDGSEASLRACLIPVADSDALAEEICQLLSPADTPRICQVVDGPCADGGPACLKLAGLRSEATKCVDPTAQALGTDPARLATILGFDAKGGEPDEDGAFRLGDPQTDGAPSLNIQVLDERIAIRNIDAPELLAEIGEPDQVIDRLLPMLGVDPSQIRLISTNSASSSSNGTSSSNGSAATEWAAPRWLAAG